MLRKVTAALLCTSLVLGGASFVLAQSKEEATAKQLEALKAEIQALEKRMKSRQTERTDLEKALAAAEIELGEKDKTLKNLNNQIGAETAKLKQLATEKQKLDAQITAEAEQLSSELKNLWALKQGGGLQVLLGDQDPQQIARNLAYYQRLLGARTEVIENFRLLQNEVAANELATRETEARLSEQRDQVQAERVKIASLQNKRTETLRAMKKAQSQDKAQVAKLETETAELTSLLEELRKTLAELDTPSSYRPFKEALKDLVFPVKGRPSNKFGETRNRGNLRWRGWVIPASEGDDVKAIHHGQVVYANWLRGQGLLLIVDHGDGWLSLYGHNRSLNKDVGEWVRPDEVIASVGNTGGQEAPGLYFEIRKDGDPVDPGKYLKP